MGIARPREDSATVITRTLPVEPLADSPVRIFTSPKASATSDTTVTTGISGTSSARSRLRAGELTCGSLARPAAPSTDPAFALCLQTLLLEVMPPEDIRPE